MSERTYTRDEVMTAANRAADLVISEAPRDTDLVNLVVNTLGAVLDDPDVSLGDAIEESYSESADTVLGWLD